MISVSVAFFIMAGEMDDASGLVGVSTTIVSASGTQEAAASVEPSVGKLVN